VSSGSTSTGTLIATDDLPLHASAHHSALGIDFHSVITRGSQYRVESMLLRLCRTQDYVLASPDKKQVSTLDDH
jgi:DNA polymerase zeta